MTKNFCKSGTRIQYMYKTWKQCIYSLCCVSESNFFFSETNYKNVLIYPWETSRNMPYVSCVTVCCSLRCVMNTYKNTYMSCYTLLDADVWHSYSRMKCKQTGYAQGVSEYM